jgi:hypothetical protein
VISHTIKAVFHYEDIGVTQDRGRNSFHGVRLKPDQKSVQLRKMDERARLLQPEARNWDVTGRNPNCQAKWRTASERNFVVAPVKRSHLGRSMRLYGLRFASLVVLRRKTHPAGAPQRGRRQSPQPMILRHHCQRRTRRPPGASNW